MIYAYTSNNSNGSPCSVYAFDADDPNASAPLWRHQLPNSARWTTCTPAIDLATGTMYVLTKDNTDSGATRLRALDITTGNEQPGSPITIAASVAGTGDGSSGGVVSFNTAQANCRPGLLFLNGIVYIAFAHNSDSFPYHGWVFGYSYDGTKFTQTAKFNTAPNGGLAGIWQAGKGLTADSAGNIYLTTGNGTFSASSGKTGYGMCFLKLGTPNLNVLDWFAPFDEKTLSDQDLDLGNIGVTGIPGTNRIFGGASKSGDAFLLDSTNLGHFTPGGPDNVIQRFNGVTPDDQVGQNAVCWNVGTTKYVYLWAGSSDLKQFKYDTSVGKFNPAGVNRQTSGMTAGSSLAVTANGSSNGILWAVGNNSVFRAFDATTLSLLWSSTTNSARDGLPSVGHFQFPTVVNGKAYVPTGSASIAVYGLLSQPTTTTLTPTADAYVRSGSFANSNAGSSLNLVSKRSSANSSNDFNRCTYLKFDLTGIANTPTSATLKLTVNANSSPSTASESVRIYSVANTSWTEGGITWNNAPGLNRANFTSTGTLLTSQSISLSPATVTIDLTAFVAANRGKVVTIQVIDAAVENELLVFNSREAASNGPQLIVVH